MQPKKHHDGLAGDNALKPRLVGRKDLQGTDSFGYIEIFRGIRQGGDIAMQHAYNLQLGLFH
jgi:hypothetical protein